MGRRRNTFSKALKHLKSTEIDEKIAVAESAPTNYTGGYMSVMPAGAVLGQTKTVSRMRLQTSTLDLDFDADANDTDNGAGRDTTGLFETDGTIKTAEPPGDTSYILGPMSAMYYGWWSGGTTTIGYIRQSDRRMVNLGTISGKLHEWDGVSLNSYGQLTLEQAKWFKDVKKKDNAGNDPDDANYRAFYPGPPSNVADDQGRYLCTITGEPKSTTTYGPKDVEEPHNPTEKGGIDPDEVFALAAKAGKAGKKAFKDLMDRIGTSIGDSIEDLQNFLDSLAGNTADNARDFADALQSALDGSTDEDDSDIWRPSNLNAAGKKLFDKAKQEYSKIADITVEKTKELWDHTNRDLDRRWDNLTKGPVGRFVTDIVDADNAIDYNAKLANNLALSIISGKRIDIPLSKEAKRDLVDNIDADALAKALTINQSTPTTGSEAVNPTGNKTDQVVKGPWGAQGGLNFNYNEKTGELEIVSNKTLRTDSGGETIVKKKIKPNFEVPHLTDIPDPSVESIQNMATKVISKMSKKLGGPSLDLDSDTWTPEQKEFILKDMRKAYDNNAISKAVTHAATDIINQNIQGAAQTAIQIRKALQQLEIKTSVDAKGTGWFPFKGKSDVENVGGAYGHVTSTTKVKFDELPPNIQKAIKSKLNVIDKSNQKESSLEKWERRLALKEVSTPTVNVAQQSSDGGNSQNVGTKQTSSGSDNKQKMKNFAQEYLKKHGPEKTKELMNKSQELANSEGGEETAFNPFADKRTPREKTQEAGQTRKGTNDAYQASTGQYSQMTPEIFEEKYGMTWQEYLDKNSDAWDPNKNEQSWACPAGMDCYDRGIKTREDGTSYREILVTRKGGSIYSGSAYYAELDPEIAWDAKGGDDGTVAPPKVPNDLDGKEIAGVNWDLDRWINKTYGGGASNWYRNNPGLPHKSNPYIPKGSYIPQASNIPKDVPRDDIAMKIKTSDTDAAVLAGRLAKKKKRNVTASYKPCMNVTLSEEKASVMKRLKEPVVIPETKQKSYKVRPGVRMRGMDKLVGDIKPQESFKKPQPIWTKTSQDYNTRQSQEKKNDVLQYVGASLDHWDYMTETIKKQGGKILANYKDHDYLYDYWLGGKKNKIVRKEEAKNGDYIVFMEDEDGKKTTILQSKLNDQMAQNSEKEAFDEYYKLHPKKEPIPYENDPLFKKVSKVLKPKIDYKDKPSKKGYPDEPPPKQVDGWHPELGKRYKYDKLDPHSAESMPRQGNPEIDANIEKATDQDKLSRKLKILKKSG